MSNATWPHAALTSFHSTVGLLEDEDDTRPKRRPLMVAREEAEDDAEALCVDRLLRDVDDVLAPVPLLSLPIEKTSKKTFVELRRCNVAR